MKDETTREHLEFVSKGGFKLKVCKPGKVSPEVEKYLEDLRQRIMLEAAAKLTILGTTVKVRKWWEL